MCKELIPDLQQHTAHLSTLAEHMNVLIGVQQRMLDILEATFGLPSGDPYIIDVASPAANAITDGAKITQASSLRHFSIVSHGAAGIVTLYIKNQYALGDTRAPGTPNGARILWRGGVGADVPVPLDMRARIPAGSTLSIATAGAGVTNLNLNAVIDQVESTAIDQFYGRR